MIARNELRIGKLVPFKVRSILQHFHVKCIFESFTKAKVVTNVIGDVSELDGFDLITSDDKSRIIKSVETGNVTRTLPPPKAIHSKMKVPAHVPSKFRKFQLKSTNLPSFNVMFTNTIN